MMKHCLILHSRGAQQRLRERLRRPPDVVGDVEDLDVVPRVADVGPAGHHDLLVAKTGPAAN